jgi:hypothetical protein
MRIATIACHSVLVALVAGAAACGQSVPPPNDEWAAAQGDVGRAQAGGAPSVPDAKLHLQLAQEDLQTSKGLIGTDNRRATDLVWVARVEAQYALSLSKQQLTEEEARKAQADLAKVKGGQ